ncbi:MAG TPA: NAD(P)-binding domain-containing protein [Ktedonobacterales bacterium]|nr:NAD(P)-binding domain-containing protein [Ktedonobacterales bacterium]
MSANEPVDRTSVFCVIGAGSSGITAAKNLSEAGIPCEVFEREDGIGGNWYYGRPNSSVCRSTHLISSKPLTEYTDFPMPREYPDYPSHEQVLAYFKAYVTHFGLERFITFNTEVTRVEPVGADAQYWDITLHDLLADTTETRRYRGVIICNGHNWLPKYPDYPGQFTGQTLHSADYKTPNILEGKRVLVVGAGNSGCDIAAESATHARKTFLSTRRGYYYMPKFFFGRPVDQVGERLLDLGLPLGLRRIVGAITYRVAVGDLSRYGAKAPDHRLFETHPIVNNQLPYFIAHGDVISKPDIRELGGSHVTFVDGSTEEIDLIVYATGFKIVFPFMDHSLLNWTRDHPSLYLNVFHPTYDNLFVVGLIQPDSGQWGLEDRQARAIARFITQADRKSPKAARFRRLKRAGQENYSGGVTYKESTRHYVEVEHHSYRKRLDAAAAQLA